MQTYELYVLEKPTLLGYATSKQILPPTLQNKLAIIALNITLHYLRVGSFIVSNYGLVSAHKICISFYFPLQTIDVILSVKENKGRRQSGVPRVLKLS